MEVLRTRLCTWEPIGIDSLALAPATVPGALAPEPRLAVGRGNGAIELWDTTTWHLHSTSMACEKRSVRGIVWVPPSAEGEEDAVGMRLFTAGLFGEITEWDLSNLAVRTTIASGGGAVWSMCMMRQKLLVACEDGSVRVFAIGGGSDEIFHQRRIVVGSTRVLSITPFGTDSFFCGGSDSRITKWTMSTATCEARMMLEKAGKDQETLVWTLASLGDHGIASGDSLGVVCVWDPVTYVVLQRFVQHQADVLSLAASADGNVFVAAGIDAVISTFCRQGSSAEQWVFRNSDVGHTHDVRAVTLDIAANARKQILSGGISGKLLVHSLKLAASVKRNKATQLSAFSPCFQRAALAEDSRLVMCQRNTQLELHYMQPPRDQLEAEKEAVAAWAGAGEVWPNRLPEPQLLVRHSLAGAAEGHHLASSAITRDGRLFAASNNSGTRLFHLSISELEVRRERGFPEPLTGMAARSLLFCSESLLVMAAWDTHRLHVVDVQKLKVTARFSEHSAPVTLLASAGEWLASGDASGSVHLYNLDSLRHQARVPAGSSHEFPTALSFDAAGKLLFIALSTHKVLIYDVDAQALAADRPCLIPVSLSVLPAEDRICSIAVLPGFPDKLVLGGHDFLVTLDLKQLALEQSQPAREDQVGDATESSKKRRRGKKVAGSSSSDLSHVSDVGDHSACVWRTYPKLALRHFFGIWPLDTSRWGKHVLENHFLQSGASGVAPEEDGDGGAKKRSRMGVEAMLLTLEVAPETIQRSLPPAFEKKKFLAT